MASSLCAVCGNKATGIHYGVSSCEGCKAFYKRGLVKSANYNCYFGKACFADDRSEKQSRCKACRFQKCLQVGMNLEETKRGRKRREHEGGNCRKINSIQNNAGLGMGISSSVIKHTTDSTLTAARFGNIPVTSVIRYHNNKVKQSSAARTYSRSLAADLITMHHSPKFTIDSTCFRNMNPFFMDDKLKFGQNTKMPPGCSMDDYWNVVQQRGYYLNTTIRAVADAVQLVYHDQLAEMNAFMAEALLRGRVPETPQVSVDVMKEAVQINCADCIRRGARFLFMLPGFADLAQSDQKILLLEKFTEIWLVVHARFVQDNETYYLNHHKDFGKLHFSSYWMRLLLEKSHVDIIMAWSKQLNDLHLTVVESFLLLAVATSHPETTKARGKTLLTFLHAHYLDCLLHSIRLRCEQPEQGIVEEKLKNFMKLFRSVYRLGYCYVHHMDYTATPFCVVKDSVVITASQALEMENDGLDQEELVY